MPFYFYTLYDKSNKKYYTVKTNADLIVVEIIRNTNGNKLKKLLNVADRDDNIIEKIEIGDSAIQYSDKLSLSSLYVPILLLLPKLDNFTKMVKITEYYTKKHLFVNKSMIPLLDKYHRFLVSNVSNIDDTVDDSDSDNVTDKKFIPAQNRACVGIYENNLFCKLLDGKYYTIHGKVIENIDENKVFYANIKENVYKNNIVSATTFNTDMDAKIYNAIIFISEKHKDLTLDNLQDIHSSHYYYNIMNALINW